MAKIVPPFVLLGAGGHSRVILALARAANYEVLGVCDPVLEEQKVSDWEGLKVLGGDNVLTEFEPEEVSLMLGVGPLPRNNLRERLFDLWSGRGYNFPALVHPASWVAPDVMLHRGVQIMAGAIIQPGTLIGENSTINTHASVDHDCTLGKHVHVAPGATICGSVCVGDSAFIGAGSTVIQQLDIGTKALVGAGTTVIRNLKPGEHLVDKLKSSTK
ncbi:MAG: acetyltransferase [Limnobacter sp. CACIAM 66H1]|uniref:acetyltransferase n=1 Tax=Limnobacter sp. CACIAM 66H1 TaxID=1813033 RepID=UPI0007A86C87|nr:acetyltransferase [Limnobacter sp. CACIAM 66H1]KYP11480.1 MAG: acetyltransferase [Limnobacter sp. CACIAM 66H1]